MFIQSFFSIISAMPGRFKATVLSVVIHLLECKFFIADDISLFVREVLMFQSMLLLFRIENTFMLIIRHNNEKSAKDH